MKGSAEQLTELDRIKEAKSEPMTVRLPPRIHAEIEAEVKRTGHTKNTVVHLWLSDHIEELKQPRLEKYVILADKYVTLWDRRLNEIVILTVREGELFCSKDIGNKNCEHILFASNIAEVQDLIEL